MDYRKIVIDAYIEHVNYQTSYESFFKLPVYVSTVVNLNNLNG